jgi:hypothetical protein
MRLGAERGVVALSEWYEQRRDPLGVIEVKGGIVSYADADWKQSAAGHEVA